MSASPMTSLRIHPAHARPAARPAAAGPSATAAGIAAALLRTLAAWSERARQRRQLTMMDDRMLQDIGLSRADVDNESAKPFWRP